MNENMTKLPLELLNLFAYVLANNWRHTKHSMQLQPKHAYSEHVLKRANVAIMWLFTNIKSI